MRAQRTNSRYDPNGRSASPVSSARISALYEKPSEPPNAAGRSCTAMYPPSVLASPFEGSGGRCRPGIASPPLGSPLRRLPTRAPAAANAAPRDHLPHHVARDERDVCRALGQPAHEIRVPLRAERHVDAHAVALADEL